ncbi:MAG: agmatine deiminase family protein [Barnesiella sp.]|nr:agmatine deiminase family protein [Barnesiella sp.]
MTTTTTLHPSAPTRRMPAEWEPNGAVLIAWPHADTDWAYMLDDVTKCYIDIVHAIVDSGAIPVVVAPDIALPKKYLADIDGSRIIFCQVATNDTWARDFGPITVKDGDTTRLLDFCFNGWGLKFAACLDNLINSKLSRASLFTAPLENHLGFVLEGGSIESDGCGTILTTSECLLSPNRNGDLSREQVEEYLCKALGARRVLWVDHGYLAGDDTDSHIDTLARLAPGDTILYVKCDDPSDEHYEQLSLMEQDLMAMRTADGRPYNLVALPMPSAIYDEDGERLPATYANFLITDTSILLPVYNQPANDRLAEQIMQIVFPERRIIKVDCSALIRQHGSLHCVTMQLPRQILPI